MVQLSYPYMTTGKTISLTIQTFVGKVMSLLFIMLSKFVIAFLPRLQSPSAVILEPKKIKSVTVSIVSLSICHEVMRPDALIFVFECWVLKQLFHCPLSLSSRGSLVPLHSLPWGWCPLRISGHGYWSVLGMLGSRPAHHLAETALRTFYLSFLELCLVNCCFALTLPSRKTLRLVLWGSLSASAA